MMRIFIAITMLIFSAAIQPAIAGNCSKHSTSLAGQASNAGIFKTLLAAAEAANLTSTLYNDGPFTLFAPTDAAFDSLPDGTLTSLLANIPQLTDVLKRHVVNDIKMSTDLAFNQIVTTLNGDVQVTYSSGVFIQDAEVIDPDILADNGVVHIIDAVILANASSVSNINIENEPRYLYTLNILGKKIDRFAKNQIVFDVYSNSDVIKRFVR